MLTTPKLEELDDSNVWDVWSPRQGLSVSADALMLDVNSSAWQGHQPAAPSFALSSTRQSPGRPGTSASSQMSLHKSSRTPNR